MASIEAQVAHIWRRLGFGPGPGDVAAGVAMGTTALINDLCSRVSTNEAYWDWPIWDPGQGWEEWEEYRRYQDRIMALFADSANPLQERVNWILMGLLVISQTDEIHYPDFKKYNHALKTHALGSYNTLLDVFMRTAGIQWYLNGFENQVGHANENLARELMELFALGVFDPVTGTANYTETDVKEVARALTGYQYNWTTGEADFNPDRWDSGNKTFLGAPRGAATLTEALAAVTSHVSYRRFLAHRFWQELVGIPASPALIDTLAATLGPNADIRALVTAIANRPEFISDAAINARVRSPMELIVATIRTLGLDELRSFNFDYSMSFMGQQLFNAPNVNGWPQGAAWLHAGQVIGWSDHARFLCTRDDGTPAVIPERQSPTIRAIYQQGGALNPQQRAAMALQISGLYEASAATQAGLVAFANGPWSFSRAAGLVCLALNAPEFYLA